MDYEKLSKEELIEALKESQDLNKKLLDLMEIQNNKFTEISIKALEEQIKSRHNFLAELEQSEPPKLKIEIVTQIPFFISYSSFSFLFLIFIFHLKLSLIFFYLFSIFLLLIFYIYFHLNV